MASEDIGKFGIGAVARMTGLTTHTIRAWENRYGAVTVERTRSGRRVYSETTVRRLQLLNRLIRLGHRIGDIAQLPDAELEAIAAGGSAQSEPVAESTSAPARIAVLGGGSASLARALAGHPDLCEVVLERSAAVPIGFDPAAHGLDALVIEIPSVTPAIAQELIDLRMRFLQVALILIYSFARDRDLEVLRASAVVLQRAPARSADILAAVAGFKMAAVAATDSDVPAPMFSAAALAEIAALRSTIDCQCPQHLAALLTNLVAFEQYSADCENRNEADAALHALLCREVGRARHIIETNLQRVIDAEGIVLSADVAARAS